jgi:hypothetical protein
VRGHTDCTRRPRRIKTDNIAARSQSIPSRARRRYIGQNPKVRILIAHPGAAMAQKLDAGDPFPKLTLNLVGGGTLNVPDGMDAKYRIVLFYRGHW